MTVLVNRLNKRVKILHSPAQDGGSRDAYNLPVDNRIVLAEVWAGIEPLQGQEFFAARAEQAEVTTRIRIRHRSDVDRTMRVVYGKTEFEILYIIHPKLNQKELQLMCKERQ